MNELVLHFIEIDCHKEEMRLPGGRTTSATTGLGKTEEEETVADDCHDLCSPALHFISHTDPAP